MYGEISTLYDAMIGISLKQQLEANGRAHHDPMIMEEITMVDDEYDDTDVMFFGHDDIVPFEIEPPGSIV